MEGRFQGLSTDQPDSPLPDGNTKLGDSWVYYFQEGSVPRASFEDPSAFSSLLHIAGTFSTLKEFDVIRKQVSTPTGRRDSSSNPTHRIFREGIAPTWEDKAHENGGRWVFDVPRRDALRIWNVLMRAIVAGKVQSSNQITGAVLTLKMGKEQIKVWSRDKDFAGNDGIQVALCQIMNTQSSSTITGTYYLCENSIKYGVIINELAADNWTTVESKHGKAKAQQSTSGSHDGTRGGKVQQGGGALIDWRRRGSDDKGKGQIPAGRRSTSRDRGRRGSGSSHANPSQGDTLRDPKQHQKQQQDSAADATKAGKSSGERLSIERLPPPDRTTTAQSSAAPSTSANASTSKQQGSGGQDWSKCAEESKKFVMGRAWGSIDSSDDEEEHTIMRSFKTSSVGVIRVKDEPEPASLRSRLVSMIEEEGPMSPGGTLLMSPPPGNSAPSDGFGLGDGVAKKLSMSPKERSMPVGGNQNKQKAEARANTSAKSTPANQEKQGKVKGKTRQVSPAVSNLEGLPGLVDPKAKNKHLPASEKSVKPPTSEKGKVKGSNAVSEENSKSGVYASDESSEQHQSQKKAERNKKSTPSSSVMDEDGFIVSSSKGRRGPGGGQAAQSNSSVDDATLQRAMAAARLLADTPESKKGKSAVSNKADRAIHPKSKQSANHPVSKKNSKAEQVQQDSPQQFVKESSAAAIPQATSSEDQGLHKRQSTKGDLSAKKAPEAKIKSKQRQKSSKPSSINSDLQVTQKPLPPSQRNTLLAVTCIAVALVLSVIAVQLGWM